MSSDQEPAAKKKVKHSRLCMDSDDELRAQQSEEQRRKRKEQKQQRKKEKEIQRERRQREREEREREREQEEEQEEQELDYNVLLQEDSNSHMSKPVRQNIKGAYPSKKDYWEEKPVQKKPKKERESKPKKAENDNEKKEEEPAQKTKAVPAKPQGKDQLVYEFAKRWWYVLPAEWPPKDFNYSAELEKEGYRIVPQESFRKQNGVVNGLTKVHQIEGFRGVYKSQNKIIDVRPKDSCPSIDNFRKLTAGELTENIRVAVAKQIADLQQVQHKQNGDQQLMKELNVLLLKYSR